MSQCIFMLIWIHLRHHKLCYFEQKMAFLGFDDPSCLDHKNWSKGRRDILRSVLQSSDCILYILNFLQFFMHFCNPDGILQVWLPKPTVGTISPFWLQKGIKSERFLSAENVFEKYRSSAFQNRSQNVFTTSSYDFMPIWSLQKTPQKNRGAPKKNRHY